MKIGGTTSPSWITLIKKCIEQKNLPLDPSEATLVKKRTNGYTIIYGPLQKRGLSTSILECLENTEANYYLIEVRKGIVGQHLVATALAKKVLRV